MPPDRQREIASLGGRAAHERGHAHEFTPAEARDAGRKGGQTVAQDRAFMSEIGRRGGLARGRKPDTAAIPSAQEAAKYLLLSVPVSLERPGVAWYKPKAAGYTMYPSRAGRYSLREAARHCAAAQGNVVAVEETVASRVVPDEHAEQAGPEVVRTLVRLASVGGREGRKALRVA